MNSEALTIGPIRGTGVLSVSEQPKGASSGHSSSPRARCRGHSPAALAITRSSVRLPAAHGMGVVFFARQISLN